MATSGVTTGLLTAGQIIETAYKLIAEITSGDPLNADEYDDGLRLLNYMLKTWGATANLWRELDVDLTWPAATRECTLSPTVLNIISLRLVEDSTERELTRAEKEAYNLIGDKDEAGTPIKFNFTKEIGNPLLRLWPVPADATSLVATVERTVEDVTSVDQTVDIPQEWTECTYYNLGVRLSAITGKHRLDPALVADTKITAAKLYADLTAHDRAGSFFITPGYN